MENDIASLGQTVRYLALICQVYDTYPYFKSTQLSRKWLFVAQWDFFCPTDNRWKSFNPWLQSKIMNSFTIGVLRNIFKGHVYYSDLFLKFSSLPPMKAPCREATQWILHLKQYSPIFLAFLRVCSLPMLAWFDVSGQVYELLPDCQVILTR